MANKLTDIEVHEVSLVDFGANYDKRTGEGAKVTLFKRAEGGTKPEIWSMIRSFAQRFVDAPEWEKIRTIEQGITHVLHDTETGRRLHVLWREAPESKGTEMNEASKILKGVKTQEKALAAITKAAESEFPEGTREASLAAYWAAHPDVTQAFRELPPEAPKVEKKKPVGETQAYLKMKKLAGELLDNGVAATEADAINKALELQPSLYIEHLKEISENS